MSIKVAGRFLGTGASLTIGLGFQPDWVRIRNVAAADGAHIEWNKHFECLAIMQDGVKYKEDTKIAQTNLTVGQGIRRHTGGSIITTPSAAVIMPVSGIQSLHGDVKGAVNAWTLETSGNRTGKFNAGVDTDLVGVGSRVLIASGDRIFGREVEAAIVALTNDGDAANEVTLNRAVASGRVVGISYKYDFGTAPAGVTLPAGIVLAETADVNVSGELCYLEAGTFDLL